MRTVDGLVSPDRGMMMDESLIVINRKFEATACFAWMKRLIDFDALFWVATLAVP